MNKHNCFVDNTYLLDGALYCAGCYARRALSVHGKGTQFLNNVLTMIEYEDLTHLNPTHPALVLRAALYKEYLDSKLISSENTP